MICNYNSFQLQTVSSLLRMVKGKRRFTIHTTYLVSINFDIETRECSKLYYS